MRQILRTFCRITFSDAIAQKALNTLDQNVVITASRLYRSMYQKACIALKIAPGIASKRDMANINKFLNQFVRELEWDKPENVSFLLKFSLELLEDLRDNTKDEYRKESLNDLVETGMNIYRLMNKPEICFVKRAKAIRLWKELIDQ